LSAAGLQLTPPYPSESEEESYLESSDELVLPQTVRQLPPPSKKRTKPVGVQTSYDVPPEEGEAVIPQGILDDESGTPIKPNTTRKRTKSIATANIPLEQPDYSDYYVQEKPRQSKPTLVADSEYPVKPVATPNVFTQPNGQEVFEQSVGNPALMSSYGSPFIAPCFGMGWVDNLTFFGGVDGSRAETTGDNGNFGFYEGLNWAAPAYQSGYFSVQAGFQAIQSNINGFDKFKYDEPNNKKSGNQIFATVGVFKRLTTRPYQGGAVIDYSYDDFLGKVNLAQLRYELSARTFTNLEYGLIGTVGIADDSNWGTNMRGDMFFDTFEEKYSFKSQTTYQLFLRKYTAIGNSVEARLGATSYGDIIFSGNAVFPLTDRFSLNGGFAMLAPKSRPEGLERWRRETWNVSVGAVFYFRGGAMTKIGNPYRPMFDVAGNGSFFNRIVHK
jgi:hypothetical protein